MSNDNNASSSSSSWITRRLIPKLSNLAESASDETLQTLARWMAFYQSQHARAIATQLHQSCLGKHNQNPKLRQRYWHLVHILLILYSSADKVWEQQQADGSNTESFDRLLDFRLQLTETALIPALQEEPPDADLRTTLQAYWQDWDRLGVLGGPTLLLQLKRLLWNNKMSSSPTKKESPVPEEAAKVEASTDHNDTTDFPMANDDDDPVVVDDPKDEAMSSPTKTTEAATPKRKAEEISSTRRLSTSSASKAIEYDFDAEVS